MTLRHLLLLLTSSLLWSCIYTPDEEFFNEQLEPEISGLSLTVTQNSDTIYVFQNTQIEFDLFNDGIPRTILEARVTFGGNDAQLLIEGNKAIWNAFPFGSEETFTKLELFIRAESTSNSLADRLGAEVIEVSSEWVLHSDPTPPPAVQLSTPSILNGKLTVSWDEPTKLNFEHYLLNIEYFDINGVMIGEATTTEFTIGSRLIFEDINFIAGRVDYWITTVHERFNIEGPKSSFNLDPIVLAYELDEDLTLTLNWDPIQNYAHQMSATINVGQSNEFVIDNLQTTTLNTDFVIDPFTSYAIIFNLAGNNSDLGFEHNDTLMINPEGGLFLAENLQEIVYHQPTNTYLATYSGRPNVIRKFDATNFQLLDELELDLDKIVSSLTSSPDGQYVYAYSQDVRLLVGINPVSMTMINEIDVVDILGQTPACCSGDITVSNNNKAVIRWFESFQNRSDLFDIINLNTRIIEYTDHNCFLSLSPDGQYALSGSELLKFESGSWNNHLSLADNEDICSYNQFEILQSGQEYHILRLFSRQDPFREVSSYTWNSATTQGSTLNPAKYLPIESLNFRNFDPVTGYASFQTANNFYIYDYRNFELKYSTKINSQGLKYFWNNTLISTNGTYAPIDVN